MHRNKNFIITIFAFLITTQLLIAGPAFSSLQVIKIGIDPNLEKEKKENNSIKNDDELGT